MCFSKETYKKIRKRMPNSLFRTQIWKSESSIWQMFKQRNNLSKQTRVINKERKIKKTLCRYMQMKVCTQESILQTVWERISNGTKRKKKNKTLNVVKDAAKRNWSKCNLSYGFDKIEVFIAESVYFFS